MATAQMTSEDQDRAQLMDQNAHTNDPIENKYLTSPTEMELSLVAKQKSLGMLPAIAFCLIGCTELFGWNALLNSGFGVCVDIWGLPTLPPMVTALYSVSNAVVTILAILFSRFFVRPIITHFGIFLTIFDASLFMILLGLPGNVSGKLLHLVGFLMGVSSSFIGCSAFGYANIFPRSYAGSMSAGLGVAGVATFAIWMLSKYVIFHVAPGTPVAVANSYLAKNSTITLQSVALILALVSLFLLILFFKKKDVQYIMNKQIVLHSSTSMGALEEGQSEGLVKRKRSSLSADADLSVATIVKEIVYTFKKVWGIALVIFFTMTVTLFIFPNIGPLGFNQGAKSMDIQTGAFQVGDLIGRYIPNIVPSLLFKKRGCYILGYARALFVILALITWRLRESAAVNNSFYLVVYFLLMAITNGWLCTAAFMEMPNLVDDSIAKARCGAVACLSTVLGIAAGQWLCTFVLNVWL